jgi:hypothetical protein
MSEGQHSVLNAAEGLLATAAYGKKRRSFHSTETTSRCWKNIREAPPLRTACCELHRNPDRRRQHRSARQPGQLQPVRPRSGGQGGVAVQERRRFTDQARPPCRLSLRPAERQGPGNLIVRGRTGYDLCYGRSDPGTWHLQRWRGHQVHGHQQLGLHRQLRFRSQVRFHFALRHPARWLQVLRLHAQPNTKAPGSPGAFFMGAAAGAVANNILEPTQPNKYLTSHSFPSDTAML